MTELPGHVHGFALIHVAMRRDARRLVAAAPRVTPADKGVVGAWFRQLFDVVEWHHRTEDEILFPELRRRVPAFAAKEQALAHDHTSLDQAMAEVAAALSPTGDLPVEPPARRLRTVLFEHLDLEETLVFPVFAKDIPVDTYLEIERRALRAATVSVRKFLYPWMFDGIDRRTTSVTAPFPARVLGGIAYRRTVAPILALGRRTQEEK
jgi:iron-sulfur cluster repair protein YtfE (RIC family)